MFKFTQYLRSELDGAHYLRDGRQAMMTSRIDELSVKLDSLQAEHEHLINEHWMPLQQFASGVVACLSVLSGMDPDVASPLFCFKCGRGGAPPPVGGSSPEDGQGSVAPIPIGLVSDDLRAFGINPSNFPSPISTKSSLPSLISASSSGESLLYSPSSTAYSLIGESFHDPSYVPHWSDHLIATINTLDILTYQQEESFVLLGELGEQEAVPAEGNSLGSSAAFEDASEEVLATVSEGAWGGGGSEGVPDDAGQLGV